MGYVLRTKKLKAAVYEGGAPGKKIDKVPEQIGVDFVRSVCSHVLYNAGDLTERVVYLGKLSMAVLRAEGGANE